MKQPINIPKNKTKEQLLKENILLKAKIIVLENLKTNDSKSEDELKQFKKIVDSTSSHMSFIDRNYIYQAVNHSYLKAHKKKREQIVGHSITEVIGSEIFESQIKENIDKCFKGKSVRYDEWFDFSGIGRRYMNVSYYPYFDKEKQISGIIVDSQDITLRKEAEEKLLQRENYLTALNKINELLIEDKPKVQLQKFAQTIGEAAKASRTYIFKNHKDEKGILLLSQVAEYVAESIKPEIDNLLLQNLSYADFIPRWQNTLSKGKIIVGKVVQFPKSERDILEPQDIKAILVIPIIIEQEFWGFIGFDNCVDEREWDTSEQDFLKTAANDLARYIEGNIMGEELREEKEFNENALNNLNDIFSVINLDGKFVRWNNRLKIITGYNDKEISSIKFTDLFRKEDKKVLLTGMMKEHAKDEVTLVTKDGRHIPYELLGSLIKDSSGKPTHICGIGRDLTERKKAEKTLKASEKKLSSFMNSTLDEFSLIDKNLVFQYINSVGLRNLGMKEEDVLGKSILDINPEIKNSDRLAAYQKVIETGEPFNSEDFIYNSKSEDIDLSIRAFKVGEGLGIIAENITDRKKTEEAIKANEERFRTVADYTYDWEYWESHKGKILYMSPSCERITGYSPNEFKQNPELLTSIVHFDDINNWKNHKQNAFDKAEIETIEFRIITKSGEERWIGHVCQTVFKNGVNIGIRGSNRDITERKSTESALQESEELMSLFMDSATDNFTLWSSDLKLLKINRNALSLFPRETKEEDVIGKSMSEISPELEKTERYNKYLEVIKTGTPFHIDDYIPDIGKGHIHLSLRTFKVGDGMGMITTDITKRKQTELALLESEDKFHNLFNNINIGSSLHEIITDKNNVPVDFVWLDANPTFEKITQLKRADIIGKRGKDILKNLKKDWIDICGKVAQTGEPTEFTDHSDILNKDLEVKAYSPKKNQFAVSLTDITERKKSEEALKTSERNLRSIFENKGTATGIFGEDKIIKTCNTKFVEMCGYSKQEIEGRMKWSDFIVKEDLERLQQYHSQRTTNTGNTPMHYECRIINKNGEIIVCIVNIGLVGEERIVSLIDITERKKAEEEIKTKQKLNELLLNSMPYPIMLISRKRKVKAANKIAIDIGVKIGDYCWKEFGKCECLSDENLIKAKNNPDDPSIHCTFCMMDEIYKTNKQGNDPTVDAFGRIWDTYWIPLNDSEFLHYAIDITEQNEAEQALKASENKFRSIFETAKDGMLYVNNKMKILDVNPAFSKITSLPKKEVVGKTSVYLAKKFISINQLPEILKLIKLKLQNKPLPYFELKFNNKILEISASEIFKSGKFAAVLRDITDRKKNEVLIQKSKDELQNINSRLELLVKEEVAKSREKDRIMLVQSKQAAMGEMIGNIAHQWRQPLNDVGLFVQNLQDEFEFEELTAESLNKAVEKTMDKLTYMSQTIDDFRNFFRSDKEKTNFSLSDNIRKTLLLTEASFKSNSIDIELNLSENIMFTGYPNEFSQALLNILNNAKDVLIASKTKNPHVHINLSKSDKTTILTISNNGDNIHEDIIDKIFEPYFTTKTKSTGTGLGLYISKTIIERNMSGKLGVRNIKNYTEFKIELENE